MSLVSRGQWSILAFARSFLFEFEIVYIRILYI